MVRRSMWLRCGVMVGLLALAASFVASAGATGLQPRDVTIRQPERVLDTRVGTGAPAHQLIPGVRTVVTFPDANAAGASSVVLNLTAVNAVADGWVKAWPCNEPEPPASAINTTPGRTSANAAIVKLAADGVCFTSSVPLDLVADFSGWLTGNDDLSASSPSRVLDTRLSGNPLRAEEVRSLRIAGTLGIDASATGAALNLTVERPALDGYVVAYPCGQPSNGSTVNFLHGETVANLTVVALSAGDVCMRSNVNVQVIVDTYGWTRGDGRLLVQSPNRLLDTRDRDMWLYGATPSHSTVHLRVAGRSGIPNTADSALLTVTVADSTADGFVTVWPCDQPQPLASTINPFNGALRSNLSLVKLAADGTVCLYFQSADLTPTDLVVDGVGWISGDVPRVEPSSPGTVVIPPPTDGTVPPGSTLPPGSTVPPASTVPAPTGGEDSGCVFSSAVSVAFCDSFNAATANPASSRSGGLNGANWTVSRTGTVVNVPQGQLNDWTRPTVTGCGSAVPATPPDDVRLCAGLLFEAVDDGGGQSTLVMSPTQPFDIAGRTGTVVFDVSSDSEGTHAAWPAFWWTDQPVPSAQSALPGHQQTPRNGFGFTIAGTTGCAAGETSIDSMSIVRDNAVETVPFTSVGCVLKGSAAALNHFEVRISATHVEVWATDAGSSTLQEIALADVAMPMTRGLISIEDVHFDAGKFNTQRQHAFAWDNVGFDGPKLYRNMAFDVQDSLTSAADPSAVALGYSANPLSLSVAGVSWLQQPTQALVSFNWFAYDTTVPNVRVNGGPVHVTAWPFDAGIYSWRTIAVAVPLSQIHAGSNTIELTSGVSVVVSNIDINLIAASPVP